MSSFLIAMIYNFDTYFELSSIFFHGTFDLRTRSLNFSPLLVNGKNIDKQEKKIVKPIKPRILPLTAI